MLASPRLPFQALTAHCLRPAQLRARHRLLPPTVTNAERSLPLSPTLAMPYLLVPGFRRAFLPPET